MGRLAEGRDPNPLLIREESLEKTVAALVGRLQLSRPKPKTGHLTRGAAVPRDAPSTGTVEEADGRGDPDAEVVDGTPVGPQRRHQAAGPLSSRHSLRRVRPRA